MPIDLKMPALSPTMEEGTLAKWLVREGDSVASGDILAEIETDKATMEFEAVDEGTIAKLLVPEGSDNVKVGTVIALIAAEGEDVAEAAKAARGNGKAERAKVAEAPGDDPADPNAAVANRDPPEDSAARREDHGRPSVSDTGTGNKERVKASPLARRLASQQGIDLSGVAGSGPGGRIVKADLDGAEPSGKAATPQARQAAASEAPVPAADKPATPAFDTAIPHEAVKLSNMRKTIARRLTEAKATIPHIYLTLDVRLDALLKLRAELNAALEPQGVKLSVNDLLIKALARALIAVPECNVSFAGEELIKYARADISVAVSVPAGLITPIIAQADTKAVGAISTEMKELAARAKDGKLQPHEYQGGTASISNMGMFGITQFDAVINPPQGMILAIGAGEKRPAVVDDALTVATMMSATGSFDHRAIDGADGARLMQAFKGLVEAPLGMLA